MLVLQELWAISQGLFLFDRVISFDEGKKLAESWKAPFLEASAKENSVSVSSSSSSSSSFSFFSTVDQEWGDVDTYISKVPSFSELGACLPD